MSGRWSTTVLAGLWLALVATIVPAAPASAQIAGDPVAFCLSRATMTLRAALADPARFDCTTPQRALPPGDYWALSAPLPRRAAGVPVSVRFASLWQRDATLHALYADGYIARIRLDGRALTRRMQMGATIEQPLPMRRAPAVRLLWHIEGAGNLRGILSGVHVATHAQSARANLAFGALYAGFAGLCIALLVYNLALWVALRHGFQLAYAAMLTALLTYGFSESGLLAWTWPDIANNDRIRINYLTLAAAGAAALLFARTFFEARVFTPRLRAATNVAMVMLMGSATLVALLAPWRFGLLDTAYVLSFVLVLVMIPAILWRAWRARSNYLWAFALAWAAPIVLASTRIANALHLVDWNFWLDNSTLVAMSVEALLSSIGIAYRIRLLAAERDSARESEIAARLLADTDPLTGLLNRRAFLDHAIGRDADQLLLLADIDHFKQVNETIGHDGGDEVLRVVARSLVDAVPAGTLVARIGGEEFAILAPVAAGLDPAEVLVHIRAARMPYDLQVTISVGAATGALPREVDWKALYRAADRALFAAKSAGRDRVRRAAPLAFAA